VIEISYDGIIRDIKLDCFDNKFALYVNFSSDTFKFLAKLSGDALRLEFAPTE